MSEFFRGWFEKWRRPEDGRKAPVHIIVGSERMPDLQEFDSVMKEMLTKRPKGTLLVVLDNLITPENEGKGWEETVAKGITPGIAHAAISFKIEHKREPNYFDQRDRSELMQYRLSVDEGTSSLLSILDKHYFESNGRIRLLVSYQPEQDKKHRGEYVHHISEYRSEINKSCEAVSKGEFDKGVAYLKKGTENASGHVISNNSRIESKISDFCKTEKTAGIVVLTSGINTKLGFNLGRAGHRVTRSIYGGDENNVYWTDFNEQVLRKKLFHPDKEIAEVDWYRYVLGGTLEGIFMTWISGARLAYPNVFGAGDRDKDLARAKELAKIKLTSLKTMEDIREFEAKIAKHGLGFGIMVYSYLNR